MVGGFVKEGARHPIVDKIWTAIPQDKGREISSTEQLDPIRLLTAKTTHYHYRGSLTTPPCTEGVHWNVLNTPIEMSSDQIKYFQFYFNKNNRPIKALNKRAITNY